MIQCPARQIEAKFRTFRLDDESFGAVRPPELIEVPIGDSLRLIYEVTLNAIE